MVTAKIASRFSPSSVRSDICLKRSKLVFAPLLIATKVESFRLYFCTYFFIPAMASAPAGSAMDRVSSKISLIDAHISSQLTVTISSTQIFANSKVISPICLTATPSANNPTSSRITRSLCSSAAVRQADSSASTPIILVSGRRYLT